MNFLSILLSCSLLHCVTDYYPFDKEPEKKQQTYFKQYALLPEEQNVFVDCSEEEVPDEI